MWQKRVLSYCAVLLVSCAFAQSLISQDTKTEVTQQLNGILLDLRNLEITITNSQKQIKSLEELIKISQNETAEMQKDLEKQKLILEDSKNRLQKQVEQFNELSSKYNTLKKQYDSSLKTIQIGKYVITGLAVSLLVTLLIPR